ncbi:hypothetical protein NW762_008096 [Fusarium torreyae]|uniref:Xylanolytic transcriptional activator regulatory domain-containing protein n=1 Tax=Fusarium torreyae TaxID=1237075 RepID=A0A9W8VFL6_9HYPO|nr:hypothetical protein NW762_008096 [Fusarium torreyae]
MNGRPYRRKRKRNFSPAIGLDSIATRTPRYSHVVGFSDDHLADLQPADSDVPEQEVSPQRTNETDQAYVGRTDILGDVSFDESLVQGQGQRPGPPPGSSIADSEVLTIHKAFDLPSPVHRDELVQNFMESCWPWTPVVDMAWLADDDGQPVSLLLLQAILVAGSRVATENAWPASETYFQKAKALFFYQHEANPIIAVVTAIVLQWWSPMGPEQVSQSNSGFWLHIATGLAYQLGLHKEPSTGPLSALRRRIWWSLVCRDILISVGVGRPRTINLDDSDVLPPTAEDFHTADTGARLFVAYVSICQILGDVVQSRRRRSLSRTEKQTFEARLYQWVRELQPDLCLFEGTDVKVLRPYDVGSRQLHVVYFVVVIILASSETSKAPSTASLVAASFIAGIHAEFASHDDVRRLGPIFAFHVLTAALSLLKGFKYSLLASCAKQDFTKIYRVLQRLAEKWGSARGLLTPLSTARREAEAHLTLDSMPPIMSDSMRPLFRECGHSTLCPIWDLFWPAVEVPVTDTLASQEHVAPIETTSLALEPAFPMDNETSWDTFMEEYPISFEGFSSVDQYWNELMGS